MTRQQTIGGMRLLLLLLALFAAGHCYDRFDEAARGRVWRHSPVTGHWYTLLRERLTWDGAQAIAERMGGHLVCIEDEGEQAWVQTALLDHDFRGAYIGLRRVGGPTEWEWVNGEPAGYTNWCPTKILEDAWLPDECTVAFAWGGSHTNRFYWDPTWPQDHEMACAVVERERNPHSLIDPWLLGAVALGLLAAWLATALLRELLWPPDDGWGGRLRQFEVIAEPRPRRWRVAVPLPLRWAAAALLAAAGGWLVWLPGVAPLNTWVERVDTGHWYQLAGPDLDPDAAEAAAERMGGHLAIIETPLENQWLVERLLNRPLYGASLGFEEVGETGRYVNADGTLQGYANWAPDEPRDEAPRYPLQKGLIHGQWGIDTSRLGHWAARTVADWWLPVRFSEVLDHALIERDTPPPPSQRPRWLAGWGLLLAALLVGLSGAGPLGAELRRRPWLVPAALATGCAGAGTWLLMLQSPAARHEWVHNPATGHWYARMPLRDGWDTGAEEAQRCGAHLVILEDEAEQQWMAAQFLRVQASAYLGLREVGREGHWRWVDGRPVGYTNWFVTALESDSGRAADVASVYGQIAHPYTWEDVPRDPARLAEERPEFAIFERDTDPAAAPRRTTTASGLLLSLALVLALIAWRGSRTGWGPRPWLSGLAGAVALGLAWVGAQPDPPGPTPRTVPADAPPPSRPADWPAYLADFRPKAPQTWADYRVSPIDGMPQGRLPAGIVFSGSPDGEGEADEHERDHRAINAFWMDLHEVTWAQYARFLNQVQPVPEQRRQWVLLAGEEPEVTASPSRLQQSDGRYLPTEPRFANRPVVWITREGAGAYAAWAGRRLPTENEWERACRGDRINIRYVWGNAEPPPSGAGNVRDESWRREQEPNTEPMGFEDGATSTADVCSYTPGPFGVFDLAGNVSEWCEDGYDPELLDHETLIDPLGSSVDGRAVRRGGAFHDRLFDQRIARRRPAEWGWRGFDTGFRCVSVDDAAPAASLSGAPFGWGSVAVEVRTVAGSAEGAAGLVDGPAAAARFSEPRPTVDAAGDIIVCDVLNNAVRRIDRDGVVTTIAGSANGAQGSEDGAGDAARFWWPYGAAVTPDGKAIFVADAHNHTIRRITLRADTDPRHASNWHVTTIAGTAAQPGATDGDGASARLTFPKSLALIGTRDLYVAETGWGHRIRRLHCASGDPALASNWRVTTVAGDPQSAPGAADGRGTAARFDHPFLAADVVGNLYIADEGNHRVRKVTPDGVVTTLAGPAGPEGAAGFADGPPAEARFGSLTGIAVDRVGNVYVGDLDNHRIRKISPDGTVSTVAGTGEAGLRDGPGHRATFDGVLAVAVAPSGGLVVGSNNTIRTITPVGTR